MSKGKNSNELNNKNKKSINPSTQKEKLNKSEKLREGIKKHTSFYRENPHRLVKSYLNLSLHVFQSMLVYLCFHYDFFMVIATRGIGKSWLIAVICCVRCILYPNTKIVVASGTKGQAKLIISEKVTDLYNNSPNLAREIKDIKTGANDAKVIFHNGSTITAVTSNDNARGFRCNILVLDEFRLINEGVLQTVLRPFLNVNRMPPYLKNPKYRHLQEENKEIYISSCYYKNHWMYDKFKSFVDSMLEKKSYFTCAFPYTLAMYHGLLSRKRVEQMKGEKDFSEITWKMEMDTLFFGSSDKAYFKLDDIQKCRKLNKYFLPMENRDYSNSKKKKIMPKQPGEVRIIGYDIALMGNIAVI